MKQHNKVSLGEAIDTFIKENKLKPQLDAMRVKSLWEKLMGKTKFNEILGGLIEKPPGKPSLVPLSDKRPAIHAFSAKTDFMEE